MYGETIMKKLILIIKKLLHIIPVKKSSTLQKYEPTNQREKKLMYKCFKHDFK